MQLFEAKLLHAFPRRNHDKLINWLYSEIRQLRGQNPEIPLGPLLLQKTSKQQQNQVLFSIGRHDYKVSTFLFLPGSQFAANDPLFDSRESFRKLLSGLINKDELITDWGYRKSYQKTPPVRKTIKAILEEEMVEHFAREEIYSRMKPPSSQEIESYFQENRKAFTTPARAHVFELIAENRQKANDLAKRVRNGEDFARLIEKYSNIYRVSPNGDLGWLDATDYAPIGAAAMALPEKQISDPIETEEGFSLIQVKQKKPQEEKELREAYDEIKSSWSREKAQNLREQYLQGLRGKFQISR
jgi:hypothetical protein